MARLKVQEVATIKGVSMRKLAKGAGIAYNTLRTMYRDPYRDVTISTLDKLAITLNVDISLLIESDPPLPKTLDTPEKMPDQ